MKKKKHWWRFYAHIKGWVAWLKDKVALKLNAFKELTPEGSFGEFSRIITCKNINGVTFK